jgi:SAM-dependent methyltransferase
VSATDVVLDHWSDRARTIADDAAVNTPNMAQRQLELAAIEPYLTADMDVLEVGCGNGHTTSWLRERVGSVFAIDRSEAMLARARSTYGETNNVFHYGDIRYRGVRREGGWDAIVCIRVLINLADLDEQRQALESLAFRLNPGGMLILVEGFADGFAALDLLRTLIELPPLEPSPINFYSTLADLRPEIERLFTVERTFHLGAFDYLTRVAGIGPDSAAELSQAWNPDYFEHLSRIRGFVLRKPA